MKQRKTQGQTTKSLHSLDNYNYNNNKRRRPYNSGELRTKSGGSSYLDMDNDDYDNYAEEKSAETAARRQLRKFARPGEQPLNDRNFEAGEISVLRRQNGGEDIDDDEDDDDVDVDYDGILVYKNKAQPLQQQQQQQMPPTSNFASTDLSAGEDIASDVKPLSSGLLARLPGPPRSLVAQIVKSRFVTLSWQEPLQNANEVVSYTVYYRVSNSER